MSLKQKDLLSWVTKGKVNRRTDRTERSEARSTAVDATAVLETPDTNSDGGASSTAVERTPGTNSEDQAPSTAAEETLETDSEEDSDSGSECEATENDEQVTVDEAEVRDDETPYQSLTDLPPPKVLKRASIKFQPKWYQEFPWLQYKPGRGAVFCHTCLTVQQKKLFPINMKLEEAFLTKGFRNWKKGRGKFVTHQKGDQHKEAIVQIDGTKNPPIDLKMHIVIAESHVKNREALRAIFSTVKFLARQGLAIRGHEDQDGNFRQLINLRSLDIPILASWSKQKKNFMSGDILNEICEIMSHHIIRDILADIKASGIFSLILDETTDCSTKEQLSVSIRYVTNCLDTEEKFLGMYEVSSTTGESLTNVVIDVLRRFNLPVTSIRGQCFDGAANMRGHTAGGQARIREMEPRALYVHRSNHCLNLALQDAARAVPLVRDALQYVHDAAVVITRSPKRRFVEIARQLDSEKVIRLNALCPTRWSVRVESVTAILKQYEAVLKCLEEIGRSNDPGGTSANGLLSHFGKWESIFALHTCLELFGPCERLAKYLQKKNITVGGAIMGAEQTISELRGRKTFEAFQSVWKKSDDKANQLCLDPPELPRKRSRPARYRDSLSTLDSSPNVQEYYFKIYEKSFDVLISEIDRRFQQSGLVQYSRLEKILLDAAFPDSEEFSDLCKLYEFDSEGLKQDLSMFRRMKSTVKTIDEAIAAFKEFHKDVKVLLQNLEGLLKVLVVIPASTATAERSFSMLRRLKTYIRSTMSQNRLNFLTILNTYQEAVDDIDMDAVMKEFVSRNNFRIQQFGKL